MVLTWRLLRYSKGMSEKMKKTLARGGAFSLVPISPTNTSADWTIDDIANQTEVKGFDALLDAIAESQRSQHGDHREHVGVKSQTKQRSTLFSSPFDERHLSTPSEQALTFKDAFRPSDTYTYVPLPGADVAGALQFTVENLFQELWAPQFAFRRLVQAADENVVYYVVVDSFQSMRVGHSSDVLI